MCKISFPLSKRLMDLNNINSQQCRCYMILWATWVRNNSAWIQPDLLTPVHFWLRPIQAGFWKVRKVSVNYKVQYPKIWETSLIQTKISVNSMLKQWKQPGAKTVLNQKPLQDSGRYGVICWQSRDFPGQSILSRYISKSLLILAQSQMDQFKSWPVGNTKKSWIAP